MRAARRLAGRVALLAALAPGAASAERTLADYRYFRALSIDLQRSHPDARRGRHVREGRFQRRRVDRSTPHRPHLRRARAARVHGRDALADRAIVSVRPELDHAATRIDHRRGRADGLRLLPPGSAPIARGNRRRVLPHARRNRFAVSAQHRRRPAPPSRSRRQCSTPTPWSSNRGGSIATTRAPTPADRYATDVASAVSELRAGERAAQRARWHDAHHRDPHLQRRSVRSRRWARSTRPTAKRPRRAPLLLSVGSRSFPPTVASPRRTAARWSPATATPRS